MKTASVVEELMLHNLSCSQCRVGEPCLVAEHIEDCWPMRVASQAAATLLDLTVANDEVHPVQNKVKVPQFSRF
ncbi:hypothetical protein [Dyella psychrodurans]|uniref:Uncharacterized protein n=1 Tax=Dyella psychrodurans TaxID=1927960 RepID=A0A370X2G3_9GAMM|nr:hypothetical protein [Dyella psychrodurans]RDS82589.1 hypothetical protein DWU99_14405 [Dyella psychrodurans]